MKLLRLVNFILFVCISNSSCDDDRVKIDSPNKKAAEVKEEAKPKTATDSFYFKGRGDFYASIKFITIKIDSLQKSDSLKTNLINENDSVKVALKIEKATKIFRDSIFKFSNRKALIDSMVSWLNSIPYTPPSNANFKYVGSGFEPIEWVLGDKFDTSRCKQVIDSSIINQVLDTDFEKTACYVNPKYELASAKVQGSKLILERCLKTSLHLNSDRGDFDLMKKDFASWLYLDTNANVTIDQEKALAFYRRMADKIDIPENRIRFVSTEGDTVVLTRGDLGLRMNLLKEVEFLKQNITKGEKLNKKIDFSMKGIPEGVFTVNKNYIEVNITKQKLWFYKNGKLILETDIVSGNKRLGRHTPLGAYYIKHKSKNTVLRGPDYAAFVSYWMPFYTFYGLHDASWRKSFGYPIYLTSGSHGCVNLPPNVTQKIFENAEVGTIVLCYETPVKS